MGAWTRGKLDSKDVRAHFRWLHSRLLPHAAALQALAAGGETYFDVLWKSTYLYAGTGPLLDADSIAGVAALGAGMGFDIYQVNETAEDDPAAFLARSYKGVRKRAKGSGEDS